MDLNTCLVFIVTVPLRLLGRFTPSILLFTIIINRESKRRSRTVIEGKSYKGTLVLLTLGPQEITLKWNYSHLSSSDAASRSLFLLWAQTEWQRSGVKVTTCCWEKGDTENLLLCPE